MSKIERKIKSKKIELKFVGPKSLSTREMAKILTTINNVHNYFVLLSEPELQEAVVSKLKDSTTRKPESFLYSSFLEWVIGEENRMKIMNISMRSPVKISLEGTAAAIDAMKVLFEMFMPIFNALDLLDKKEMMLRISSLGIEVKDDATPPTKDQEKIFNKFKEFTDKINSIDIKDDFKVYVIESLRRNIRSINANPINPMLTE